MSLPVDAPHPARRPTATSAFGVGRRESHDASGFYARFAAPVVSTDDVVCPAHARTGLDTIHLGDIRDRPGVLAPASVALVVTSPPYFSGKAYEAALGEGGVPGDYREYLDMVTGVLAACVEVLEPGGRMAVNVANLGRKPYRSLSADVVRIMEEDLGLLLRGEVLWRKARGAAGNCAWGSFQRPADPVLRDLTERVVVASKGRFDRAGPPARRAAAGLPCESSLSRDEFMESTVDVWELPTERATRVGHPAPFPVSLPERLIHLYTYRGDLVLDPFMGSGSTAVAAIRTGRHFAGFDTDAGYVESARRRVALETAGPAPVPSGIPATADDLEGLPPRLRDAVGAGLSARQVARITLEEAGFTSVAEAPTTGPADLAFSASDAGGGRWLFDVTGTFSLGGAAGLRRPDVLWRSIGKAAVVQRADPASRLVLLSTELPPPRSRAGRALRSVTGWSEPVAAVARLLDPAGLALLGALASGEPSAS